MKTVEDAVRDLKGVWPSREDRCSSLYVYKDGDYHALDPQWHDDYTGVTFVCSREEFDECKAKLEGKSMKLIDILARELEEWPEGAVYVVQDYDGNVKYSTSKDRPSLASRVWIRTGSMTGKKLGYMAVSADLDTAIITREQWEEARRELKDKAQWCGPQDGLPPVGIECEYSDSLGKWVTVEITAIAKHGVCFSEKGSDGECYVAKNPKKFRPLKSDRDRWIDQACESVETEAPEINVNIYCSYAIRKTIEVIYDAGLGKMKEE